MQAPKAKTVYGISIKNFTGIDMRNAPSKVDLSRSPMCINMIRETVGNNRKRHGYETILTLDGKINCDVECNPIQAETVKGVIEKMQAGEDYEATTLVEDQAFVAPGITSEYATTMTVEVLAGRAY